MHHSAVEAGHRHVAERFGHGGGNRVESTTCQHHHSATAEPPHFFGDRIDHPLAEDNSRP
ncbi:hypothetical protein N806_27450 [Rhodococcus sp. P27]|nr:hypothetical protein N806_27450 [Rhodococcus sp. P27]